MVTGHQQMNQAGSEKKCSKSVSNECVLKNYNYDEVSADHNSINENCKQGGWSASADGKHSSNVGSICNTEHAVEVAGVRSREDNSQLQPGASNSFEQSLLQKAWMYLQSIIYKHRSSCPRCNPRPPPDDESPKESRTKLFQRTTPSAATLSFRPSCCRTRPICSRTISLCHNARPSRQRAFSSYPGASPPNATSPCAHRAHSAHHKCCTDFSSDPPSPKAKSSKTSIYHKFCTDSLSDPPSPKAKPPCPNTKSSKSGIRHKCCIDSSPDPPSPKAKSFYPNTKSSKSGIRHKCCIDSSPDPPSPEAKSPCPNAKSSKTGTHHMCCTGTSSDPPSPEVKSPCPNAKSSKTGKYHSDCHHSPFDSPSPNAKPLCLKNTQPYPNYKSSVLHRSVSKDSLSDSSHSNQSVCSNAKPVCSNAKPVCSNAKPVCSNAKPVCSNAKPVCSNAKPVCLNSKTCLYHSFSHDSLSDSSHSNQSVCSNAKPVCSNAKPVCSNAKPVCSNAKPVCSNAKPVCSNAKPVCLNSKTCLYHSFSNDSLPNSCKESLVEMAKVYLENLTSEHKVKCPLCAKQCSYYSLESITSYLRGMLEQAWNYVNKPPEQKSSESICSNSKKSGILKSKSSKPKCCCPASKPKTLSFHSEDEPRNITCPTCLTHFACPKVARLNFAPDDDDAGKCEEAASPDRRSEAEGTHDNQSCYTYGCMHDSKSAQPSFNMSITSGWSYEEPVTGVLYIKSRQIKTPQSEVEELKASVTGITDKSPGNVYGDFEGHTCTEEALCPNQSCSEGSRKSEANVVDVIGEESVDCTVQEKDALRKDPHNYRFYY